MSEPVLGAISISVIIPLFNKEYHIEKTLRSVLSQSCLPNEIVVVNDGSTDAGFEIALAVLEQSAVPFVVHDQSNQGVSVARNVGVEQASSDYIALLDADDSWDGMYLELMQNLISKYPTATLYSCGHRLVSKVWQKTLFNPDWPIGSDGLLADYYDAARRFSAVNSSKVVMKKNLYQRLGGFKAGVAIGEDQFFWLTAASYGVAYLNKVLVTVVKVADHSRHARDAQLPYPLVYYGSNAQKVKSLSLRRYLWKIYLGTFLGLVVRARRQRALTLYKTAQSIFPVRSTFLLPLTTVPLPMLKLARTLVRKVRRG